MKRKLSYCLLGLFAVSSAAAQGLYYTGTETQESLPLKWVVGANVIYDDNISPGAIDQNGNNIEEDSFGINGYVGLSFVNITPQTTWDVYARLGLIYYFDAPDNLNVDDVNSQSRLGVNLTHRFDERLRFSSRNFVSYELEPDYAYGYASSRSVGEYLFYSTDNALGYRWSERFATYSGVRLYGVTYNDVDNNDRFTWQLYNQFRYQLSPQTVLTADYRYQQTSGDGLSSDSSDHFVLGGVEHRFSPNTIAVVRAGAQFRDVDDGDSHTSPYVEFALNSQINDQFRVRSFARYGIEGYDTVQRVTLGGPLVEFDDRETLRIGLSGEYAFSPMFSLFGGLDWIHSSYSSGRALPPALPQTIASVDEDIVAAYIGVNVKLTDYLYGTASYTFTNSSSDIAARDYDRNRLSVGVRAEF